MSPTDTPEMQQESEGSEGVSRADTWGRGFETGNTQFGGVEVTVADPDRR